MRIYSRDQIDNVKIINDKKEGIYKIYLYIDSAFLFLMKSVIVVLFLH